jgi:WD40 repeat protein
MRGKHTFVLALAAGILASGLSAAPATKPPITALAFAPDGQTIVAGSQAGVQVYSWPALELERTITAVVPNIHDLAFSPDGNLLAVAGGVPSEGGLIELYSWPGGEPLRVLEGHDDSVLAVAWLDPSSLLSGSLDYRIIRWNVDAGSSMRELAGHSRGVSTLVFLKDGHTMVSAGIDQSVRAWDIESGDLLRTLNNHTQPVHALATRPGTDGLPMVASAGRDRTVRLWQPTIGRMVRFARLAAEPLDIAWSNDGSRLLAACADGNLRIIDPASVEVVRNLPALDGWAYALAVHPRDGSVALGGADGQLRRVVADLER